MKAIAIADLHFTDKPRDAYRFKIFGTLKKFIQNNQVEFLFILGDLTEYKDRHSSYLVNIICSELVTLSSMCQIIILKGNHDYIEESNPFFNFLKHIPDIYYPLEPYYFDGVLLLPHTKNFSKWETAEVKEWSEEAQFIFMHQPVTGARVYKSYYLSNCLDNNIFQETSAKVIAGDIHTPQIVGNVEYVGAPYPIKFGDEYQGRFLYIEEDIVTEVVVESIRKLTVDIDSVEDLKEIDFKKDDQVKIRLFLYQSEFYKWAEYKAEIKKYMEENNPEVDVCGICTTKDLVRKKLKSETATKQIEESDVFDSFCRNNSIDKVTQKIGLELVK